MKTAARPLHGATVWRSALVFAAVVSVSGCNQMRAFPSADVVIATASGLHWTYRVEIAATGPRRRVGLMYRHELAGDHGMLLWFPHETVCGIWMKNTYVPLDILFIDSSGRIVKIAARARPLSARVISSGMPVQAVLEINGGQAAQREIRTGARIIYQKFREVPDRTRDD